MVVEAVVVATAVIVVSDKIDAEFAYGERRNPEEMRLMFWSLPLHISIGERHGDL
jgi:hypothetical protein